MDARFRIIGRQMRQHLRQRLTDFGAGGRLCIGAAIEQVVEQQRMRAQAFGHPAAAGHHFHQSRQRRRLFIQQRQIAGTAQHRLHQRQTMPRRLIRRAAFSGGGQQRRQYPIHPCPCARRHRGQRRLFAELLQLLQQGRRGGKSGLGQALSGACIGGIAPDFGQCFAQR